MTRPPLYAIVWTDTGLAIVPAVEVPRRAKLLKRQHAEDVLAALTKDPVEVTIREAFGPGEVVS